jgi:hypothetical protein
MLIQLTVNRMAANGLAYNQFILARAGHFKAETSCLHLPATTSSDCGVYEPHQTAPPATSKPRVMKYEDIVKEQEARDEKELKPKAPRGRPRLNREPQNAPKPEPKRKQKISEQEEAVRELRQQGLENTAQL